MTRSPWLLSCSLFLFAACGGDDGDAPDALAADAGDARSVDAAGAAAVSIGFGGRVGDAPFACGVTRDVGTPSHPYEVRDLRFFVHDVRLLDDAGEVAVVLDEVEGWQTDGLALVDLEDASGTCAESGTPGTHAAVTGVADRPGPYRGLVFTLGVPEVMNHLDPASAPAPLSTTSMLWVWRSGYKFLRIDGLSGSTAFHVHLGSTGCPGDVPDQPPTAACSTPNRPTVRVEGLDPTASPVILDVAALLMVLAVTSGFQLQFRDKVLGVNAHVLVMRGATDFANYRDVEQMVSHMPHVVAVEPFIFEELLVTRGRGEHGVIAFKGVDPARVHTVLDVGQHMVEGSLDTLGQPHPGEPPPMIIGKELATKLKAKVGDVVTVVSPTASLTGFGSLRAPRTGRFTVSGIFYCGFAEYDGRLTYVSLQAAQEFLCLLYTSPSPRD